MDQHLEQYVRKLNTLVPSIELSHSLFSCLFEFYKKLLIITIFQKMCDEVYQICEEMSNYKTQKHFPGY